MSWISWLVGVSDQGPKVVSGASGGHALRRMPNLGCRTVARRRTVGWSQAHIGSMRPRSFRGRRLVPWSPYSTACQIRWFRHRRRGQSCSGWQRVGDFASPSWRRHGSRFLLPRTAGRRTCSTRWPAPAGCRARRHVVHGRESTCPVTKVSVFKQAIGIGAGNSVDETATSFTPTGRSRSSTSSTTTRSWPALLRAFPHLPVVTNQPRPFNDDLNDLYRVLSEASRSSRFHIIKPRPRSTSRSPL